MNATRTFANIKPVQWQDVDYFRTLAFLARVLRSPMDYFENLDEYDFLLAIKTAQQIVDAEREAMERAKAGGPK